MTMEENDEAAAGALKNPRSGSPSNSPSEFVNTNDNPQKLQEVAGAGGNNKPPEAAPKGTYGDDFRTVPQNPFRFANLEMLQMQQGGVLQNTPPPAKGAGSGVGRVPSNPSDFHSANVETCAPSPHFPERVINCFAQYIPLCRAITQGDLQAVKRFLNERPDATNAWVNHYETPLIHACACGQTEIAKELVRRLAPEQMMTPARADIIPYHTPLTIVAANGNLEIAEALLEKNRYLIEVPGQGNLLPVSRAVWCAQEEMARYLFSRTHINALLDLDGLHGTFLLLFAIFYGMLDIALDMFQACPRLAITKHPRMLGTVPTICLASRPDLFPSGCDLGFWGSLIYSWIEVKAPADPEAPSSNQNYQSLLSTILNLLPKWFGINRIYELKEKHVKAYKLLKGICEELSNTDSFERQENGLEEAFFCAVKYGNKEFLVELIKADQELLWLRQKSTNSNLFHLAVKFRQEKIFSLYYGLDRRRDMFIGDVNNSGDSILHIAGESSPPKRVSSVCATLRMQRELQWFKEVKSVLPEIYQERENLKNAKPLEIFEESHEPLRKEAEEWMKYAATSCTVVAALIVTVTFAAIFTIPGGTHGETGDPLHLRNTRFMVFIVSDLVSFFASCTSVLIFLGILTARYSFDDFLVSLPTKMITGLSILFVSIAAMLVAFSAALFTTLYRTSWLVIPVIVAAFLPALLFVLLQYPLLKEMIISTYGKGIFDRKMKLWLV